MHAPDVLSHIVWGIDAGWSDRARTSSPTRPCTQLSELDHRDIEAILREIVANTVQLVGVVIGPEPDPIADALIRQCSLLYVCLPAGECEPGLQVLGIGLGSERARLQPEAFGRFGRGRSFHARHLFY